MYFVFTEQIPVSPLKNPFINAFAFSIVKKTLHISYEASFICALIKILCEFCLIKSLIFFLISSSNLINVFCWFILVPGTHQAHNIPVHLETFISTFYI